MKYLRILFLLIIIIFSNIIYGIVKIDKNKLHSLYEYAQKYYAKYETKNLEIYFEKNSPFRKHIVIYAKLFQDEVDYFIKAFEEKEIPEKIIIVIINSDLDKLAFSNENASFTTAIKDKDKIKTFIFSSWWSIPHEIVHGLCGILWGKSGVPFVDEAFASWFRWYDNPYIINSYNKTIKKIIIDSDEFKDLTFNEKFKRIFFNFRNGYTFGISFFDFIRKKYGYSELKKLYQGSAIFSEKMLEEKLKVYAQNWFKWLEESDFEGNYYYVLISKYYNHNLVNNLEKNLYSIKNITNDFYFDSQLNALIFNFDYSTRTGFIYYLNNESIEVYNSMPLAISKNYIVKFEEYNSFYILDKNNTNKKIKLNINYKYIIPFIFISENEKKLIVVNGEKVNEINEYSIDTGKHIKTMNYNKYISTINEIDGNIIYGTTDGNIIMENKITKISNEPIRKIVETEKYIIILSGMDELSILEKNTLKIIKNINNNEYIHDISINKKIQALYILYEKGIIQKINLKDFKIEYEKNAGFDPLKNKVILTDKYFIKSDEDYINFYLLEEGKKENEIKYEQIKLKKYKECEENIMYYEYQNGYEIIENEYAELTIKKEDQTILKKELEDYLSKVKIVKDKLFISCENGVIEIYDLKTGELLYKDKKIQKIADFDGKYIYYGNKNNEIVKYDYKNKKELKKYKGHYGIIQAINLTKDNKYIISYNGLSGSINSNPGNRILIHTLGKEAYIRSITILNPIKKTIILKDGYQLLIEDTKSNIFIYNILNGKLENIIMHPLKNIKALDINENKLIITDGEKIMIYNITTGEIEKALITKEFINNMKYIEDNKIAIIVDNIIYINEGNK
ncbi:WD40 repeat domain-containing protein [Marinitoga aeolica]|uniref:Uncharacterized protein n=1 Tax=Marinitoga aeolica TaxID=2809031 RepID=A0ABY8PN97_9BACT|nr:hypothetical protein [Marinitoga aeolica]WGS64117.1 hypothetical protein JRV97_06955 [Marinitoga aeolica]